VAGEEVDELVALALLAEPVRKQLYTYIRSQPEPVGREEAARHTDISVKLAAFHLDRLAAAGLLDVSYRRLTGRVGPGAGRPAKLYSGSRRRFTIATPPTNLSLASHLMATALTSETSAPSGLAAVQRVATTYGRHLGAAIRSQHRSKKARRLAVRSRLEELGFEPHQAAPTTMMLRNCAFAELTQSHRELVCGMNAALVSGVLDGAELPTLRVEGGPSDTTCCVRIVGR
jgi:predicted ArsR family transcriptional regulator